MELSIIKTEEQYIEYCKELMKLARVGQEESDDGKHLSLLIKDWDQRKKAKDEHGSDPIELLKFLMESKGLKRNDLVDIMGVKKSAISQILNYQKGLSKEVIRLLSKYFKVSQEAFNRPYPLTNNVYIERRIATRTVKRPKRIKSV